VLWCVCPLPNSLLVRRLVQFPSELLQILLTATFPPTRATTAPRFSACVFGDILPVARVVEPVVAAADDPGAEEDESDYEAGDQECGYDGAGEGSGGEPVAVIGLGCAGGIVDGMEELVQMPRPVDCSVKRVRLPAYIGLIGVSAACWLCTGGSAHV
jgi:hypothetical protein